jgi:hypothetical protein
MAKKQLAALAALLFVSTPGFAQDLSTYQAPGVMFYYSIPLDARTPKEYSPNYGMRIQGNKPYEVVNLDKRLMNSFLPLGGLEAKFIIAGVVAAGAAIAVSHKSKSTQQSYQDQQQAQAAALENCPPTTCP